jgi:DNA-binding PadR family transcriptional regulator
MLDFDPRDFDSHDRDDRRPGLSRGGHGSQPAREPEPPTRDPREIAVRHVDLPRGPRREPVRVRDRDYDINGDQSRVLATVGAFRVVSSRDLEASLGRAGNPRSPDLRHLRESGLVQTAPLPGHRDRIVTLTDQGREVLEARRRPGEDGASQAFYAGIRKPRELEHDTQVYRAYLEAADRLTERGDRLRRVVLDYELKREYQRFLQERNRGRADSDGRPDRSAEEIALWAVEHNLPYFDEQVHFPDVRIEYEDIDGRCREEDVEVTTVHYRGAHGAAAAKAGFSQYSGLSARISGRGGSGRAGGGVPGRKLAEELLR